MFHLGRAIFPCCWDLDITFVRVVRVSLGSYAYTAHLLTLAGRRSQSPLPSVSGWSHTECPLSADVWGEYLASHLDRAYCNYLVCSLREGFRIDYRYGSFLCRSASAKMQSAEVHPNVIIGFLS